MLYRFLYLDKSALDGYVSALEDGLRQRVQRGTERTDVNAKVGSAEEFTDTPSSRFARLLSMAKHVDEPGVWSDLADLDDMDNVQLGTLIHVEADAYIPDAVRMVGSGELGAALDSLTALRPMAEQFGFDMSGVPNEDEVRLVQGALNKLELDLVFVGESDSGKWKIAGRLKKDCLIDSAIDGPTHIIGKVSRVWPESEWKPLLALPGASLVPREQRRALERTQPKPDQEDEYLRGPAAMLDVLALYR